MNIDDIRNHFVDELEWQQETIDRGGNKMLEMVGASFIADDPCIFGTPNTEYIDAEIRWYLTQSTNVGTLANIYGKTPVAWQATANLYGEINSNYGHLIFAEKFHNQFKQCLNELKGNPFSRRAIMVYNRPSIWIEYNENSKNDFICTNAVSYYIRDNMLQAVVQMRSNDCWAGYRNDYAWQIYVMELLKDNYNESTNSDIKIGNLHWQVQNLHVYERNFYLVDHYSKTGEHHISKSDYISTYPKSEYI